MKKVTCILLVCCIVLSTSFTSNALDMIEANSGAVASANVSPGVWAFVGRMLVKVIINGVERLLDRNIDLQPPLTPQGSNYIQLATEDIDFNQGDNSHTYYFDPEVNEDVIRIRMFGHRVFTINPFSSIAITLRDAEYDVVFSDTRATHAIAAYEPSGVETLGEWEASFTTTDSVSWQLFYQQYYNRNNYFNSNPGNITEMSSNLGTQNNDFVEIDGRVFWYTSSLFGEERNMSRTANDTAPLSLSELNDQFVDENGFCVDYLKDFEVGDIVSFSETIYSVQYDADSIVTTFNFMFEDKIIGWKFSGDYRNLYAAGDSLNLDFEVVDIGDFSGHNFESLDYFEEAYAYIEGEALPELTKYMR